MPTSLTPRRSKSYERQRAFPILGRDGIDCLSRLGTRQCCRVDSKGFRAGTVGPGMDIMIDGSVSTIRRNGLLKRRLVTCHRPWFGRCLDRRTDGTGQ